MSQSNLPDTQDISDVVFSQDAYEDTWGMLYSTKKDITSLTLVKTEYSVGRAPTCDIVLTNKEVKVEMLGAISKLHFKIKRDNLVVHLEDCSFNGTFVNSVKVGKGNKVILQHHDQISLAVPSFRVFVYIDPTTPEGNLYPEQVKQRFVVLYSLGSGSWGNVNLVIDKKTSEKFAMKSVPKFISIDIKNKNDGIMNEVEILRALEHPCIINFYDVIDTQNKLFIILELMEGGNLFDRILLKKQIPEDEARWLFYQMIHAVNYLHTHCIAHRDLKPENVLLASNTKDTIVKITDFGLSKYFSSQAAMRTQCGTSMYLAPEIIETCGCGFYNQQVDVWSLGVVLYVCLCGCFPFFKNNKTKSLSEQICSGAYTFPPQFWKGVSSDAIELIKKMMTVDPKKRISSSEVLFHKWLQNESLRRQVEQLFHYKNNENAPPPKRRREV